MLIHPQWLEGCPKYDEQGREYGGSATDSPEATIRWNNARAAKLRLLEVRGTLPEQVTCPETEMTFFTDKRGGTVPKKSTFACAADGSPNDVLAAIKATGKTGPNAAYAIHGYSPTRATVDHRIRGGSSPPPDVRLIIRRLRNGKIAKTTISGLLAEKRTAVWFHDPHEQRRYPESRFYALVEDVQPVATVHSFPTSKSNHRTSASAPAKESVFGGFQQYLRNQNMFCIWDIKRD